MKPDQERVKTLLTDTVTLLCKNGLHFRKGLKVQGLLGITLDDDDVFIVHINEMLTEPTDAIEVISDELDLTLAHGQRRNVGPAHFGKSANSLDVNTFIADVSIQSSQLVRPRKRRERSPPTDGPSRQKICDISEPHTVHAALPLSSAGRTDATVLSGDVVLASSLDRQPKRENPEPQTGNSANFAIKEERIATSELDDDDVILMNSTNDRHRSDIRSALSDTEQLDSRAVRQHAHWLDRNFSSSTDDVLARGIRGQRSTQGSLSLLPAGGSCFPGGSASFASFGQVDDDGDMKVWDDGLQQSLRFDSTTPGSSLWNTSNYQRHRFHSGLSANHSADDEVGVLLVEMLNNISQG